MSNLVTSNVRSITACMRNHIIVAVKNKSRLPHFILIFPDKDIIEFTDFYGWGISFALGAQIDWFLNEIESVISTKKEDLAAIRPGAIHPGEPKVIYVKMIEHPHHSRAMSVRWKFNRALEDSLLKRKHGYIMDVKAQPFGSTRSTT